MRATPAARIVTRYRLGAGSGLHGGQQRVGEREHHRHADADQERRIDQAGEQEHAALQHRDQFRLAGSGFKELRAHDADAEGGAERTQADDDADGDGGEGLDVGKCFHGGSPVSNYSEK